MARLALFCVALCVALSVTCAQLMGAAGPLSSMDTMGSQQSSSMNSGLNPLNAFFLTGALDMNPWMAAAMMGPRGMGMGGGMGGFLMPYFLMRGF